MNFDLATLTDPTFRRAVASGQARIGFSQLGEDAVLHHLFGGRRDGFYVDVGCHDPFRYSNTALFSAFYGWTGVNIDLDDDAISRFALARPHDRNICAGVARSAGTAEVTMFSDGAVNSLEPSTVREHMRAFAVREVRTIPVSPLRDILNWSVAPGRHIDLMSIDVEGVEHDVLMSNDWDRFRPDVVAVEAHIDIEDIGASPTYLCLRDLGYRFSSHVIATSIYTMGRMGG